MTNDTPDVLEQVPAGGGMNKPASGTYGEKTELAALQQELPVDPAASQPNVRPTPAPPAGPARPAPAGGLPKGLLAPTTQPDVPASTPLAGPVDPFAGAVDARQRRLALLDILSRHPEVSPETREFADTLKRKLIERG